MEPDIASIAEQMTRDGVGVGDLLDVSDTPVLLSGEEQPKLPAIGTGSDPLSDPREESFVQRLADGVEAGMAYRETVSARCSALSARQQASRMRRRGDVAARLRWLIACKRPAPAESAGRAAGAPMTRADLVRELEGLSMDPTTGKDVRLRALERLARVRGWAGNEPGKRHAPDPAYLVDFLRQAAEAGRDPVEVAREDHQGVELSEPAEMPAEEPVL